MRDNPNDSVKNILGPEIENASRLEMANQGDEFEEGQNISRSYEYVDETDIGEDSVESENFDGDDSEAAEPSESELELAKDWSQTLEVTSELTDDPVRMYLREMGSVELLSREGEIEIAKRIEVGKEQMISGLCNSPLTQRAVLRWNDALKAELVLVRDIIDLESAYAEIQDVIELSGTSVPRLEGKTSVKHEQKH